MSRDFRFTFGNCHFGATENTRETDILSNMSEQNVLTLTDVVVTGDASRPPPRLVHEDPADPVECLEVRAVTQVVVPHGHAQTARLCAVIHEHKHTSASIYFFGQTSC